MSDRIVTELDHDHEIDFQQLITKLKRLKMRVEREKPALLGMEGLVIGLSHTDYAVALRKLPAQGSIAGWWEFQGTPIHRSVTDVTKFMAPPAVEGEEFVMLEEHVRRQDPHVQPAA